MLNQPGKGACRKVSELVGQVYTFIAPNLIWQGFGRQYVATQNELKIENQRQKVSETFSQHLKAGLVDHFRHFLAKHSFSDV
jgi:hypothetical protein